MKNLITTVLTVLFYANILAQSYQITVTNPTQFERKNETVTINLAELFSSNPELTQKSFLVFNQSKELVSQLIDENSDGVNDILIFQDSFRPKEKKKYSLKVVDNPKTYDAFALGKFVLPRQDFAWENDRIAFRNYGSPLAGDVKNGIDVWTKRVRYPIIEKWYKGEEQIPRISYHEDHGEGADYFSVGKTLGCGGIGFIINNKLIQTGLFSYYKIISNGPIRVSVDLYYPNWMIDTFKVLEVKRITLDAGSNMNKVEEKFICNYKIGEIKIAAGLAKRKNAKVNNNSSAGWMTLFGPTTDKPEIGELGTAIVFQNKVNVDAIDDEFNWMLASKINTENTFTYYCGAGWTKSGDFSSEQDWNNYVETFSKKVNQPLIVTLKK